MRKLLVVLLLPLSMLMLGASCTLSGSQSNASGVFFSGDRGQTWQTMNSGQDSSGKSLSLSNYDIRKIVVDPRDSQTIFLATQKNGVFVSSDGGKLWKVILANVSPIDVVLDSTSQCVLYVVTTGKLLKTTNCGQEWQVSYNETRTDVAINVMAIDTKNPEIIYIGTSYGDIFKSVDRGVQWSLVGTKHFASVSLVRLLIDRDDSSIIYLGTLKDGLFRSNDGAVTWKRISTPIESINGAMSYRSLQRLSTSHGLWYVSAAGIFESMDAGDNWKQVLTLTPSTQTNILTSALNPNNDAEMYYATNSTFYHSIDAAKSWSVKPLATTKSASFLTIDPNDSSKIYLGTRAQGSN